MQTIYKKTRENTKAVSVLQTHTEIQIYEKRPKNNDCVVFLLTVKTHTINNYRKSKNTTIKSKYTAIPNIVNITK